MLENFKYVLQLFPPNREIDDPLQDSRCLVGAVINTEVGTIKADDRISLDEAMVPYHQCT